MPKVDGRLEVWRRTVHLFHRTVAGRWEGPFLRAGYDAYRVGPLLLDSQGQNLTPDIVATSRSDWAVLDLTLRPASKAPELQRYSTISPSSLRNHGLASDRKGPVLAVVRPKDFDDGGFPQILVGSSLETRYLEKISDDLLRESLRAAHGADFSRLPEIPIAFVPESKAHEIRRGLVPIVMELFRPDRPRKTPLDIVDDGLERLADIVSIGDKHGLASRVKREMEILINGGAENLKADIAFSEGSYQATLVGPPHQRSMDRITRILKAWSGESSSLDDFMNQ